MLPDLSEYTSKYGQEEGWRKWAISMSKLGYGPGTPSLDWIGGGWRNDLEMAQALIPHGDTALNNPELYQSRIDAFRTGSILGTPEYQSFITSRHDPITPETATPTVGVSSTSNDVASGGNVAAAANNLANASKPKVPQFITPYQNASRGFGAFGERDIF